MEKKEKENLYIKTTQTHFYKNIKIHTHPQANHRFHAR